VADDDSLLVVKAKKTLSSSDKEKKGLKWGETVTVRFYDPKSIGPLTEEIPKDYLVKVDHSKGSVFQKPSWVSRLFSFLTFG